MYVSSGNKKIHKSCLIFNLPTSVCFGCGKQCKSCFALKAEYMYPNVLPCRLNNLKDSKKSSFTSEMIKNLSKRTKKIMRIHESGDFYSQSYINKWKEIIQALPHIQFYAYSKKLNKFDFSEICSLPNFNVINSKPTEKLANYGSLQYINMLKEKYGYDICPCGIEENLEKEKICMNTCKLCLLSLIHI